MGRSLSVQEGCGHLRGLLSRPQSHPVSPYSGPAARKQDLMAELRRNAVPFDVRKLHVGDFMWVARERVQPRPGRSPQASREGGREGSLSVTGAA